MSSKRPAYKPDAETIAAERAITRMVAAAIRAYAEQAACLAYLRGDTDLARDLLSLTGYEEPTVEDIPTVIHEPLATTPRRDIRA